MKNNHLFQIFILALSMLLVLGTSFGLTTAWFTANASDSAKLTVGGNVKIELSTASLTDDSDLRPGGVANFNPVTISAPTNSSSCYVRMSFKITKNVNLFLSGTLSTTTADAYWVFFNGYYYLVNVTTLTALPTATQLVQIDGGSSTNFSLTNINIPGEDIGNSYASAEMKVLVNVEAAQSAHYADFTDGTWSSTSTTAVNWADKTTYNN